jgi:hypothetical protein
VNSLFREYDGWTVQNAAIGKSQPSNDSPARAVLRYEDVGGHDIVDLEQLFTESFCLQPIGAPRFKTPSDRRPPGGSHIQVKPYMRIPPIDAGHSACNRNAPGLVVRAGDGMMRKQRQRLPRQVKQHADDTNVCPIAQVRPLSMKADNAGSRHDFML